MTHTLTGISQMSLTFKYNTQMLRCPSAWSPAARVPPPLSRRWQASLHLQAWVTQMRKGSAQSTF